MSSSRTAAAPRSALSNTRVETAAIVRSARDAHGRRANLAGAERSFRRPPNRKIPCAIQDFGIYLAEPAQRLQHEYQVAEKRRGRNRDPVWRHVALKPQLANGTP